MRAMGLMALMVLLAACKQEPPFDERYRAAQQRIAEQAAAIDRELDVAASDAAAAQAVDTPSSGSD